MSGGQHYERNSDTIRDLGRHRRDERDDSLNALEAKADSITSFDLTVRTLNLDLDPNDYDDFRENFQRASQGHVADATPSQWAESLIQAWTTHPHWIGRHMIQTHPGHSVRRKTHGMACAQPDFSAALRSGRNDMGYSIW